MIVALALTAALAQDSGWGDDDIGFADPTPSATAAKADSPWTLYGYLRTQEALWVERLSSEPLALARQTGELSLRYSKGDWRAVGTIHGEVDPYYLLTDNYDPATTKEYGYLLRPGELYVSGSTKAVEVAVGRQLVAWGEGVLISPVDRVASRDTRDPGMTDIASLRLPVGMVKASAFGGGFRVDLIGVFEADYGYETTPEGPFGLVPGVVDRAEVPQFIDKDELLAQIDTGWSDTPPRFGVDAIQPYARVSYSGRGFDVDVYGAYLLDKQGVVQNPEYSESFFELTELTIPLDHRRYLFTGMSASAAPGDFMLRTEFAADIARPLNIGTVLSTGGSEPEFNAIVDERTVLTPMLGVSYVGISHTRIDLEASQPFLVDSNGATNLTMPVNATQYAARVGVDALRDRLAIQALFLGIGTAIDYGFVGGGSATYELADGLHATLGYVTFQPGEGPADPVTLGPGPLVGLDTHDRLFTQVKWDF